MGNHGSCRHINMFARFLMCTIHFIFLSWHAAKSFIKNLTLESFIPTSMLSINKKTMWLGVTSNASEVPNIRVDTDSWRHLLHQLVRFSHAFPFDSFSRTARTRSTFSADNYRRWEKTKTSDIHKLCKSIS